MAKEHLVFSDTESHLYHFSVDGSTVKDGIKIPPEVSVLYTILDTRTLVSYQKFSVLTIMIKAKDSNFYPKILIRTNKFAPDGLAVGDCSFSVLRDVLYNNSVMVSGW